VRVPGGLTKDDFSSSQANLMGAEIESGEAFGGNLVGQFGFPAQTSSSSAISGAGSRTICEPGLATALGERPNAQDVGGALGHADSTARIEQVEQMAGL
jgi:hypothetical protein